MVRVGSADDDLLGDLRTGDSRAWEVLYDSLASDLRSYIARIGGRDPDDLLGETMLQLVRDVRKFGGTYADLRPWAFRIARNRVIDAARRRGRRPVEVAVDDDEDRYGSVDPLADVPDPADLEAMLAGLTEDQREVIWLRYVVDMPLEEVAGVVGKDPAAVAALTHRAMRRLRAELGPK